MRIATWNINSIRMRLDGLKQWLELRKLPELVCLQETKVEDDKFPKAEFEALGYKVYFHGQKTYNGVAILSRVEAVDITPYISDYNLKKEARLMVLKIGDMALVNVYVPNGQEPQSAKFVWKFEFLQSFERYLSELKKQFSKIIVCGDINIAPEDIDVYDPAACKGGIMFTQQERGWLRNLLSSGFEDVFRKLNPEAKEYSWYDYRSMAFDHNLGWRIDFILASKEALGAIEACKIDIEPRGWEKPSDHCPVVAKLSS